MSGLDRVTAALSDVKPKSRLPRHVEREIAEIEYDGILNGKRVEAVHRVTSTGLLAATSILQTRRSLSREDPLAELVLADVAAAGLNAINLVITRTAFS